MDDEQEEQQLKLNKLNLKGTLFNKLDLHSEAELNRVKKARTDWATLTAERIV